MLSEGNFVTCWRSAVNRKWPASKYCRRAMPCVVQGPVLFLHVGKAVCFGILGLVLATWGSELSFSYVQSCTQAWGTLVGPHPHVFWMLLMESLMVLIMAAASARATQVCRGVCCMGVQAHADGGDLDPL